jgi:hypothetical protein
MVHSKVRAEPLDHLKDTLEEKQDVSNGLWVLVDKPYYCDSIKYKFDTSSAFQETD